MFSEIHDNFTRDQQQMFPGQPGSSNSCTCDSCLQISTPNNINNFDIDGSTLNFTQTTVTSCNRTSCGCEKERYQQACINGQADEGQCLNGLDINGQGLDEQVLNGQGLDGQDLTGRGFNGQGLGDQGLHGQSLDGQPPCYNCFCDDCENERLLDPDETVLFKINNNKIKDVTEPTKTKSRDKSPCQVGNRQFVPVHNGSESVCTCDISKIYADAIAHAKCTCGDYNDNRYTKTKQNRYSDPNERFYKIAELTQRSSSEGDICEHVQQFPQG